VIVKVRTVTFDKKVYGLIGLKKAAYRFIDKVAANISDSDRSYDVEIRFSKELSDEAQELFISEFTKEVLDQDLREKIKTETESYRNLILAHAFSKTALIENE
jgi:His-Xaa-Ser system protein HxsD